MAKKWIHIISAATILVLVLTSCSLVPKSGGGVAQQVGPNGEQPTVSFTLKTSMKDGKLSFEGVGGDLDGVTNPDLKVKPGDVVSITLEDGDGMQHDVALPDFNVKSDMVSTTGDQVSVVFKVDKDGVFPYFCSLPGHRQAGMEGKLIVGDAKAEVDTTPTIARSPDDLPGPITRSEPQHVRIDLTAKEIKAKLTDGVTYTFWTFDGKVPGPFIRVRVGDTLEVHLKNDPTSTMAHSIDLHAVTGPGGGAVATQTQPGAENSFTFQALNPGIYVYHCATPMVAQHISNGMYGMILVEPEGGLPKVDKEFYVMQGEIYTQEPMGQKGDDHFDQQKLLDERPEYFILNGAVGALTQQYPLHAKVGETVRIFYGDGGPNFTSSFHVIGEIFDRVYEQGSLTSAPLTNVQTTTVPAGGATAVELTLQVPGRFILVDHALARMERGLAGYLIVDGDPAPQIFDGTMTPGSGH